MSPGDKRAAQGRIDAEESEMTLKRMLSSPTY